MKLYFTCTIIVACGFLAMGMQLGLFGNHRKTVGEESAPAVPEKKQVAPRAKFPQELAPAAHAQPVSIAAQFEPGDLPHKMVFLKPSGGLPSSPAIASPQAASVASRTDSSSPSISQANPPWGTSAMHRRRKNASASTTIPTAPRRSPAINTTWKHRSSKPRPAPSWPIAGSITYPGQSAASKPGKPPPSARPCRTTPCSAGLRRSPRTARRSNRS